MSPLDDEVRRTLATRADDVSPPSGMYEAVERRARRMRLRKAALATVGTLAVATVGIVGGMTLTKGSTDTLQAPPVSAGTPSFMPTPSPVTTATPELLWLSWPYRTGEGADALDPSGTNHPLWAGTLADGTTSVVIGQQTSDDGTIHTRAWVFPKGGDRTAYQLDGVPIDPEGTREVSFVIGDRPCLVVVGEPGTGQVEVSADHATYEPLQTVDGVASICRQGPTDAPVPQWLRLLDGDGNLDHPIYEGPVDGPSDGPRPQPSM